MECIYDDKLRMGQSALGRHEQPNSNSGIRQEQQ